MLASSAPLKRPDLVAGVQALIAAAPVCVKHFSPLSSGRTSPNAAIPSAPAVTSVAALNATRFIVLVPDTLRHPAEPRANHESNWLSSYFHVAARRVLERRQDTAARRTRRHQRRVLRLDPFDPIGPPRARMLGRGFQPLVDVVALRLRSGPVLVLGLGGRVDHAGDVAGAGEHVFDRPAEQG